MLWSLENGKRKIKGLLVEAAGIEKQLWKIKKNFVAWGKERD